MHIKSFVLVALSCVLALVPASGQNSISPEAMALFEKAKAAHGGTAIENIKTYRDVGTYTVFNNGQVIAEVQALQFYDFPNERLRLEIKQVGKPVQIQQLTKTEAWTWTAQSGVVKMPASQIKPMRDSQVQGFFALRNSSRDLEMASALGEVKLRDGLVGQGLSVTIQGVKSNFVLASDGSILGSKETVDGVDVTTLQNDFRDVEGIKWPFKTEILQAGRPYVYLLLSDAKINIALGDADFTKPQ